MGDTFSPFFDLDKGDWVAPYGSGTHADLLVYVEDDNPGDMFNRDFRLTVTFLNEKDGIIMAGISEQYDSELDSDHDAPLDGYQSEWVQVKHRTKYKVIE